MVSYFSIHNSQFTIHNSSILNSLRVLGGIGGGLNDIAILGKGVEDIAIDRDAQTEQHSIWGYLGGEGSGDHDAADAKEHDEMA